MLSSSFHCICTALKQFCLHFFPHLSIPSSHGPRISRFVSFRFGCRVSQSLARHSIPFWCWLCVSQRSISYCLNAPRTRTFLLAQIKCIIAVVEKLNCIRRSFLGYYPIKPLANALDLFRFIHKVHHAKMVKMRHQINTIRFSLSHFFHSEHLNWSVCLCIVHCTRKETNHIIIWIKVFTMKWIMI